jgi:DVNP family
MSARKKSPRKSPRKSPKAGKRSTAFVNRRAVVNGEISATPGGLAKKDIKVIKVKKSDGTVSMRYVSKENQKKAKNNFGEWNSAVKKARKELDLTGFVPVGGSSLDGKHLLKAVRQIIDKK